MMPVVCSCLRLPVAMGALSLGTRRFFFGIVPAGLIEERCR
jgi:hypothetical protein